MKLLLDTHILLWAASDPEKLPGESAALLSSTDNELIFSAASLWEIAIKSALGRRDFRVDVRLLRRGLLENGYAELPIRSDHAVETEALPPIHNDPFDRILIAQARVEGITLLSSDHVISQYPGPIRLAT